MKNQIAIACLVLASVITILPAAQANDVTQYQADLFVVSVRPSCRGVPGEMDRSGFAQWLQHCDADGVHSWDHALLTRDKPSVEHQDATAHERYTWDHRLLYGKDTLSYWIRTAQGMPYQGKIVLPSGSGAHILVLNTWPNQNDHYYSALVLDVAPANTDTAQPAASVSRPATAN